MTATIATFGYGIAAAAYLFLSLLLALSWRGRITGVLLMIAALTTAAWAAAMGYFAWSGAGSLSLRNFLEVAQKAAWFAFLLVLLGYAKLSHADQAPGFRRAAAAIMLTSVALLLLAVVAPLLPANGRAASMAGLILLILAPAVFALVGMLLVEHLYRNTGPQHRWSIKYLCLGLGGLFAFEFYLFSDALLFRRINPELWGARGIVAAMVAPLIAVSAARNPGWSLDVFVSRRAVFHSTTLLGASAYLLMMAAAGYYSRYYGGNWGGILRVTFLFGAGVLLVLMFFSGTLRARVRVFLSRHFFSYRYDYREEWLRFTRTLSEGLPGVRREERPIEALAQLCESPGGALWVRGEDERFEVGARWNMPDAAGAATSGSPLVQLLEQRQPVLNIDEAARQQDPADAMQMPDWLLAIPDAWLVVPLLVGERLTGFVVLARSKGALVVDWEVSELLKTAGRQAANYIAQAQAAEALARARQFESFNRMSAFVVHDLKNLVAQLSLMLTNARRHRDNPEFQADMIETVENSVAKMNRILKQLRSGGSPIERPGRIRLDEVVRRAVDSKSVYRPVPTLSVREHGVLAAANEERLERVVGHLVQNAVEATSPDGRVHVTIGREGGVAVVEIEDNGAGMSEEFIRNGLFKPFESTKSTGMGIGTYESREYIREIGGDIQVSSRPGEGTRFRVVLPIVDDAEGAEVTMLERGAA